MYEPLDKQRSRIWERASGFCTWKALEGEKSGEMMQLSLNSKIILL